MVAIKAHFDGSKIQLPPELRHAQPGEVMIVVPDAMVNQAPSTQESAQTVKPSIWDAFGKAPVQRTREDIERQLNADRDEWDRR
ncbi:MAG TPA: hypothetical protein VEA69_14565 [Tepidisphaeraceae bacterium]|nr:hypothetical protein [Tepidisphaeraceae bacterium]